MKFCIEDAAAADLEALAGLLHELFTQETEFSPDRDKQLRALAMFIDEPSLGLAPVLVNEVYQQIASIAQSGTTVLLVEENVTHVRGVANRLCLMETGRIVMSGSVDEVLADPSVMRTYLGVGD